MVLANPLTVHRSWGMASGAQVSTIKIIVGCQGFGKRFSRVKPTKVSDLKYFLVNKRSPLFENKEHLFFQ